MKQARWYVILIGLQFVNMNPSLFGQMMHDTVSHSEKYCTPFSDDEIGKVELKLIRTYENGMSDTSYSCIVQLTKSAIDSNGSTISTITEVVTLEPEELNVLNVKMGSILNMTKANPDLRTFTSRLNTLSFGSGLTNGDTPEICYIFSIDGVIVLMSEDDYIRIMQHLGDQYAIAKN